MLRLEDYVEEFDIGLERPNIELNRRYLGITELKIEAFRTPKC